MAESERLCRTCLRVDNLAPIFPRSDLHERYSLVLFLATGLQITIDDGLPQTICKECIYLINSAIDFRNRSHKSERRLIQRGHKRKVEPKAEPTSCSPERSPVENLNTKVEYYCEIKRETISTHFEEFDDVGFMDGIREVENRNALDCNIENCKSNEDMPEFSKKTVNIKIDKYKKYCNLTDQRPLGGRGPYVCKVCRKTLKHWSIFKKHAQFHLGFDYICEFCGKTFTGASNWLRHGMALHGKERTRRCPMCDYLVLDSEDLKVHVRRVHTGDRPFVCDACGASFITRRGLIHHLDVHRTERTVKCALCPAKFKSAQQVSNHKSTVHRPFRLRAQCYLCESSYSKLELVRKHLIKVHGVERQHQKVIRGVSVPVATHAFLHA